MAQFTIRNRGIQGVLCCLLASILEIYIKRMFRGFDGKEGPAGSSGLINIYSSPTLPQEKVLIFK